MLYSNLGMRKSLCWVKLTDKILTKTLPVKATLVDTMTRYLYIKKNALKIGIRTVEHRAQILTTNLSLICSGTILSHTMLH